MLSKARFRFAKSEEEALKLIKKSKVKNKSRMKEYRGKQKLWDENVWNAADERSLKDMKDHYHEFRPNRKTVTLPKLKFLEKKDD
jgi:hypothetical protein